MLSLRERQKRERRDQILEAARELFTNHGYSKTNMDAIAEMAQVGVATIYAYFENKEGVVSALSRKDVLSLSNELDDFFKDLPKDPIEGINVVIDTYSKLYSSISYEHIREVIIRAKNPGPVRDMTFWIHDQQVNQIKRVLDHGKKVGTVPSSLDTLVAAGIVIDLLDRHTNRISSFPEKYDSNEPVENSIKTLFSNWMV